MNKLKAYVKRECSGWTRSELFWLFFATAVIFAVSICWKDTLPGIIASLTGIWYVIFMGKARRSAFLFGAINIVLYAYVSFCSRFYGEVMLNVLYYLPMNFIGWFSWKKLENAETGEVQKEQLALKNSVLVYGITAVGVLVYGFILKKLGGNLPFIDSASTVLSITAQYLAIRRMAEQWILWLIVNVISVVMWGIHFVTGGESVATLAMWSVYVVTSVIMLIRWNKTRG